MIDVFGMILAAAILMLSDVSRNRRNIAIIAVALSIRLRLQLEPDAVAGLTDSLRVPMVSGLLPTAFTAIVPNLVQLGALAVEATEEVAAGRRDARVGAGSPRASRSRRRATDGRRIGQGASARAKALSREAPP